MHRAVQHGVALSAVCVFAKLLLVFERHGLAGWLPQPRLAVYLQRDLAVGLTWALAVWAAMLLARRLGIVQRVGRVLVGVLGLAALYVGLNISFFRSFSTPLNRGLLDMSGDAVELGDSALRMVTVANVLPVVGCLVVASGVAWAVAALIRSPRRAPRQGLGALGLAVLIAVLGGSIEGVGADPRGLDRNALWEGAALLLPVRSAAGAHVRHRARPVPRGSLAEPGASGPDLSHLRGAAEGMNVVLVVLESSSASYLGPWGGKPDPMPRLSGIAENALVFDAWYTSTPASMKSLFSLMCSTWPYPRATAETYVAPRLPCRSLSEVLAAGGHRGALVHSGRFAYTDKHLFFEDRGFETMVDAESNPAPEAHRSGWGIEESASVAEMERFLDEIGESPFFLAYVPVYPHHPYTTPPDVEDRFGTRSNFDRYRSALAYVDGALGDLHDALAERGHLEDTLFVVVGDHGEAFGQHEGNWIHSTSLYDENVRVPALIANPMLFDDTRRYPAPADHTALAPTVLDLLGLPAPERWQGRTLLQGERDPARFFTDYAFLFLGLRDGRWKYIHQVQSGAEELYDLHADPEERRNLVAGHPELAARFRSHLEHWYHRQLAVLSDYEAYLRGGSMGEAGVRLEHLVPVHAEQGWGRLQQGRSVGREPLRIAGETFETGLGTHAPSTHRYELDGDYTAFEGAVGRDQAANDGVVVAEIRVDGKRVFSSGRMRRDTPARRFQVTLVGAQTLELRTLGGGDRTRGDHVDWVDAWLY